MKATNKPTYIRLFSSAGIGCYGFKLEGFDCVATNELITRRLSVLDKGTMQSEKF